MIVLFYFRAATANFWALLNNLVWIFRKRLYYSDLPNNRAANLIIFLGEEHLHNLIRTYLLTCLLISEILPSKPDFHLYRGYLEVSVVIWFAPRPPVRESRVRIQSPHRNLTKFILIWVF